jgi:hypothetical protein
LLLSLGITIPIIILGLYAIFDICREIF